MSSERAFWTVALLCPGVLAVAFAEAGRGAEFMKPLVLVAGPALLVTLGWLSGHERWTRWSLRVVAMSAAFVLWDMLLSTTVYPGWAKDVDWTPARVAMVWAVTLLIVGPVFAVTALTRRRLMR